MGTSALDLLQKNVIEKESNIHTEKFQISQKQYANNIAELIDSVIFNRNDLFYYLAKKTSEITHSEKKDEVWLTKNERKVIENVIKDFPVKHKVVHKIDKNEKTKMDYMKEVEEILNIKFNLKSFEKEN